MVQVNRSPTRVAWPAAWPATIASGLVLGLVLAPPFLALEGRTLLSYVFSLLCHQLTERTLHLDGIPLAACSRCVGIYAGLFLGTFLYRGGTWSAQFADAHARWMILASVSVPGFDWIAGWAGFWDSGHLGRILTGLVFGLIAGTYLARGVAALRRRSAHQSWAHAEPR